MKCQILFSRKNKQNMTSLSAESALSLVSVEALSKIVADDILIFFILFFFFFKEQIKDSHEMTALFSLKKKKSKCHLLQA